MLHQPFSHALHHNQALLGDAGQVVIERSAVDDIFRRFYQIRRFINDTGRVARASANDFLTALHAHRHNARAAGNGQNRNARMGHHLLGGFKRRFRHGDHQIADAAAAEGNLLYQADELERDLFCSRMRAEVDAVACRQHADAVVDDGFRRVGAWRDGPDNAKR